ncbi:MAG: hypothetical protein J6A69_12265 [Clostridia bacterium]|nr:hypothetical protein [Clostridia bacterium]
MERTVSERYIAHAYNEHSNPIKEALRGQLALTKEDIKTAIEKLSKGESRVVQDTYTTKGQPSVLSEIQINGYSYYAEEILKDSFDLRTIYKAPTPTRANVPGTMRPGTVPRNRDVSASVKHLLRRGPPRHETKARMLIPEIEMQVLL